MSYCGPGTIPMVRGTLLKCIHGVYDKIPGTSSRAVVIYLQLKYVKNS